MGDDVPTSSEPLALESSFTQWARFARPSGTVVRRCLSSLSSAPFNFSAIRPFASSVQDVGPVLPWLRSNVRTNLTENERQRVRVETYAWGTPVEKLRPPFDCILCADVVYEKACIKPLVQSLLALSHRKTVVFVANERRAPEIRAEFMRHLDAYFHYLKVPRSELDANFLKEAIEVFEMKVKKRRIPFEMQINVPKNDEAQSNSVEKEVDHCDCDHWNDLLRDLSIDPAEKENSSNVVKR
ncbi:Putative N2,N2-dimethylguanosine tRNA methyltransferase [Plasmopara halstedii]|uniref:Putative N2,N2-dimethylguanosine tRNA methyltransferase n=1 Tax=Plasmopara halstedii TaxID=4781 RepID=A0A0P1B0S4_PLAHL|nr:Putative N2,N2-dimethylguanosine tRNA methyltransferase [Plasmopara halstedii]CEG47378.1 Putative N2,N2-dimethylguanosine tRNA methyltransferase [Plasmopara halstedii]|eukprot:XP_024583747.1 Putative N2,N2-dimethylguanosine tRNA methyltransferase [Plasmopara halstedii]